jgi:hypothetical protein
MNADQCCLKNPIQWPQKSSFLHNLFQNHTGMSAEDETGSDPGDGEADFSDNEVHLAAVARQPELARPLNAAVSASCEMKVTNLFAPTPDSYSKRAQDWRDSLHRGSPAKTSSFLATGIAVRNDRQLYWESLRSDTASAECAPPEPMRCECSDEASAHCHESLTRDWRPFAEPAGAKRGSRRFSWTWNNAARSIQ